MNKLGMIIASLLVSVTAARVSAQDAVGAHTAVAASVPAVALSTPDAEAKRHQDDPQTLFGRRRILEHSGFYAAPSFAMSSFNDDAAITAGVRSAWIINRRFGLGFAVNGFSTDLESGTPKRGQVEGGYGGLLLQYYVASNHWIHGFIDTTVGGGAYCHQFGDSDQCDEHGFFLVEPTANLELNVARNVRAQLGAGYRVAIADENSPLSDNDLSGFVVRTSVAFGRF